MKTEIIKEVREFKLNEQEKIEDFTLCIQWLQFRKKKRLYL